MLQDLTVETNVNDLLVFLELQKYSNTLFSRFRVFSPSVFSFDGFQELSKPYEFCVGKQTGKREI